MRVAPISAPWPHASTVQYARPAVAPYTPADGMPPLAPQARGRRHPRPHRHLAHAIIAH